MWPMAAAVGAAGESNINTSWSDLSGSADVCLNKKLVGCSDVWIHSVSGIKDVVCKLG